MILAEAEELLKDSFPDDVERVVREVRWRLLGWTTIEQALVEGRDDDVACTIEAFNSGAYI